MKRSTGLKNTEAGEWKASILKHGWIGTEKRNKGNQIGKRKVIGLSYKFHEF